ncbi:caspase-1-like [Stegastes partitus]|uniref:Caspase-1-like n=1 Tax=Stegastes partitus TaxID=144197 RepID=A0A3B5A1C2_9TELE|nr:PREDICTED: caspase-1-like [Stegastes partitus]
MAAKMLARARTKFVEKVSKVVLTQLLDDLLDDGVLNDGEKDSILEENMSKADKARDLVDTVKKKGDEASRKMIAHLKDRDATLYSELGLSCSQPAQPAAQPKMKMEWSPTLVHSTDSFWREKMNDSDIYPVDRNSIRNRVALLITNMQFANEKLNRKGAEKDEKNMEKLLSDLSYDVVKHKNLTAKDIDKALVEFSKHPKLKETDSVLVIIMSHGKLGEVLGVNCENEESTDVFPIDNIYKHLGPEKCPALLNKPKILIIQACRGGGRGHVFVSDNAAQALDSDTVPHDAEDDVEEDNLQCVHKEKDFISLLSSTPDTVSYRSPSDGSVLIQKIVEVFNTFAHKDNIDELFRRVMKCFEDLKLGNKRQMPTKDRCTLTRHFYFFPGH